MCEIALAMIDALGDAGPVLAYTAFEQRYFAAVQAGMDSNYEPMQGIFRRIIARTQRLQGRATRA